MAASNTQRTLRALRQEGYICAIAEKWNPYVGPHGIRQDMFGIFDVIAIKPIGICGVQSCGQDFKKHKRKILESEYALEWLKAGGTIEIYGWRKIKLKRGGKAMRWAPRIENITVETIMEGIK